MLSWKDSNTLFWKTKYNYVYVNQMFDVFNWCYTSGTLHMISTRPCAEYLLETWPYLANEDNLVLGEIELIERKCWTCSMFCACICDITCPLNLTDVFFCKYSFVNELLTQCDHIKWYLEVLFSCSILVFPQVNMFLCKHARSCTFKCRQKGI